MATGACSTISSIQRQRKQAAMGAPKNDGACFLNVVIAAPFLGLVSVIVGVVLSALILLASFLIHLVADMEPGVVAQSVETIAGYLPIAFGLCGVLFAFITDLPTASVFGSACWASGREGLGRGCIGRSRSFPTSLWWQPRDVLGG
jgi:Sec-independent protein secretion pathway component TatC